MTTAEIEEWRPIPGFEGYEVSDLGRVRSWRGNGLKSALKPRPIKARPIKGGYLILDLRRGSRHFGRLVHRLVLEAFVGPCPHGMEACHGDGNPANNRLGNLRWDTHLANVQDCRSHGTALRGESVPSSTLTQEGVLAIAEGIRAGVRQVDLAKAHAVSKGCIGSIASGRSWGWLTGIAA